MAARRERGQERRDLKKERRPAFLPDPETGAGEERVTLPERTERVTEDEGGGAVLALAPLPEAGAAC